MNKHISKFKSCFTKTIKCILAGIVALVVLSGFCYLFSYSGARVHNESGATDFKWSPNQWRSTVLEGYTWFRMDNYGFNNVYDNSDSPDILLMGSSHMEAANVKQSENVASILENELSLDVYNIAISGHTIYNCVDNMDAAVKEYQPKQYLILETVTAELSIDEMQKVVNGELESIESYDSGIVYMFQKYIPALKTMYKQFSNWKAVDANQTESLASDTILEQEENYEEILYDFLLKAKSSAQKSGSKLIIFYHPEIKIDSSTNAYTEIFDKKKFELFGKTCDELDIIYVDMTQTFKNMYEQEHILPYGFSNTAVGAAHLNKHGHRAITDDLIKAITEDN